MKNFENLKKTFFIAEIGNNHEGSFKQAIRLIDLAKNSGADAVKFQTFETKCFIHKLEKKRFNKLKSFQLSKKDFKKLSSYAKKKGLLFISTPFDLGSAKFLSDIVDVFKISSGDNNYFELIKLCASYGKPLIISTGLINLAEIKNILNLLKKMKFPLKKLTFLHCVSDYPVQDNDANLLSIKYLQNKLPVTIGYSDHVIGIESCLAAVCLGAKVIEKHFTSNNNFSNFRDHKISLDPTNMKKMIVSARRIENMLGIYNKKNSVAEKVNKSNMRRSIYFKKDLQIGETLKRKHFKILRPYKNINPNDISKVIGKKLKKNVKEDELVSLKILQ